MIASCFQDDIFVIIVPKKKHSQIVWLETRTYIYISANLTFQITQLQEMLLRS